jgi:hypothetical protein
MITTIDLESLTARAIPLGDCLIFRGVNDYSSLKVDGHVVQVHRIVAHLAGLGVPMRTGASRRGPRSRTVVAHKCDNKGCIKVEHLEVADYRKNLLDAYDRNRR